MRILTKAPALLLILWFVASPLEAQMLFRTVGVDSSCRLEFLSGEQRIRYDGAPTAPFNTFRVDLEPKMVLLAGVVELSPREWPVSARIAASTSVFSSSLTVNRTSGLLLAPDPISAADWHMKQNFTSWEVAGLYHLCNSGGYRFSLTGGYRQETWTYSGDPVGGFPDSATSDLLVSHTPFIGLQTAMYFPWWKVKAEVLGSRFMNQAIYQSVKRNGAEVEFDGRVDRGGMIEFQVESTVGCSNNLFLGFYARYTYQELRGESQGKSGLSPTTGSGPYDLYHGESIAISGANVTLVYSVLSFLGVHERNIPQLLVDDQSSFFSALAV